MSYWCAKTHRYCCILVLTVAFSLILPETKVGGGGGGGWKVQKQNLKYEH